MWAAQESPSQKFFEWQSTPDGLLPLWRGISPASSISAVVFVFIFIIVATASSVSDDLTECIVTSNP